jgi:hypothetical protein
VADAALQLSLAGGEYDALARSLEEHWQHASEAVLVVARAARDRLKERRKKESVRLRKQHGGAMGALQQLQGLSPMAAADALRESLQSAAPHAGSLPALDEELEVVRVRLEGLAAGAAAPLEAVASGAVALTLEQLRAATDGFASSKLVGSGGFGKVFAGTLLPSLLAGAVPLELRNLPVAVKKARSGHSAGELQGLQREVTILRECSHPHLLPLLACAARTRTPEPKWLRRCNERASPRSPSDRAPVYSRQVLFGPGCALPRLPADARRQLRRSTQARGRDARAPAAAGAALAPHAPHLAAEAPHHGAGDTAL